MEQVFQALCRFEIGEPPTITTKVYQGFDVKSISVKNANGDVITPNIINGKHGIKGGFDVNTKTVYNSDGVGVPHREFKLTDPGFKATATFTIHTDKFMELNPPPNIRVGWVQFINESMAFGNYNNISNVDDEAEEADCGTLRYVYPKDRPYILDQTDNMKETGLPFADTTAMVTLDPKIPTFPVSIEDTPSVSFPERLDNAYRAGKYTAILAAKFDDVEGLVELTRINWDFTMKYDLKNDVMEPDGNINPTTGDDDGKNLDLNVALLNPLTNNDYTFKWVPYTAGGGDDDSGTVVLIDGLSKIKN